MADVKISGLPASTTPLAGTEVLPIVQGGATKQVSIANVTAGRSVAALSVITPTIQAEAGSAGGTIKNGSGVAQMQWGSGGASNLSLEVATNINPANAAVSIAPTGTGTLTINPATASTMNNVAIGGTTPLAAKFTTLEATSVSSFADGTALLPSITNIGDTNTGIFFPAADTIAFTEGGVEAVRLHSSGGVSIGNTTDPGATNLSVTGSTSATSYTTNTNLQRFSAYKAWSTAAAANLFTVTMVDTGAIAPNSGWGGFEVSVYSSDVGFPYGGRVQKLWIAIRGSTNAIDAVTLVQEDKASNTSGTVSTITWSASASGRVVTLTATPSTDSGTFYVYALVDGARISSMAAL